MHLGNNVNKTGLLHCVGFTPPSTFLKITDEKGLWHLMSLFEYEMQSVSVT
uniref:FH2 domain-containing protein n=1 Tax=Anguilla anguilla TaxID=7936 RepID=A0A0E9R705_ANGAN